MCHTQGDIFHGAEKDNEKPKLNHFFFKNAFGGKHRYKGEIEDL